MGDHLVYTEITGVRFPHRVLSKENKMANDPNNVDNGLGCIWIIAAVLIFWLIARIS
jgi:hypothetical protein